MYSYLGTNTNNPENPTPRPTETTNDEEASAASALNTVTVSAPPRSSEPAEGTALVTFNMINGTLKVLLNYFFLPLH